MDIVITPGVIIEKYYMHKISIVQTLSVITIPKRKIYKYNSTNHTQVPNKDDTPFLMQLGSRLTTSFYLILRKLT